MALTSTQLTLLEERSHEVKIAVEIGITSPLRYCSGDDAVTIDSDVYTPWPMDANPLELAEPQKAKTRISFHDPEGTIRSAFYSERFSGSTINIFLLLRQPPSTAWTQILSIPWECDHCEDRSNGWFDVVVNGSAGHRQRAGLAVGTRAEFAYAPDPGEILRIGPAPVKFYDW